MVYNQTSDSTYLTSLLAISSPQFLKTFVDNVYNKTALLYLLKQNSGVDIMDGGSYIQIPLMSSGNTAAGSYSYYDTLNIAPQKGFVSAETKWARYYSPITISGQEIDENSGEGKVLDILSARTKQAMLSFENAINGDLYLDGTGNQSKDLVGLAAVCEKAATMTATYLGIPITVTAWANKYYEIAIASTLTGMDYLYYQLADGSDAPDLIVVNGLGMRTYETYNRSTGVGIAYQNAKLADAGFANTMFKGVPMTLDQNCPDSITGTYPIMYMLNSKYLGFQVKNMKTTPFVQPEDQDAQVAMIKGSCQLVTNNRRRQGVLVLST